MVELLWGFVRYWRDVFMIIGASLLPRADLFDYLNLYATGLLIYVPGVAFVAGASLLLGQSVILFLNRVSPLRFALSLLIHGIFFVAGLLITAAVLWLVGSLLFERLPQLSQMLALTALTYAPLAFGFLILIPFFGIAIEKLLYLWSAVLLVVVVRFGFETSYFAALICVGLAYGLRVALYATLGRPLIAFRSFVLRNVVGSADLRPSPAEIREQVSLALAGTPKPGKGAPGRDQ